MVSLLAWLIATVGGLVFLIRRYRPLGFLAAAPLLICIGTFVILEVLRPVTTRISFEIRRPGFETVITDVQSHTLQHGTSEIVKSDVAYFVLAERTGSGKLQMEFVTGGGFPVKHWGYVYTESGSVDHNSVIAGRWQNWKRLDSNWFRISD
jgi:hypothetical protein